MMIGEFVNQWIELIRPIFPPDARIRVVEGDDVILIIDWILGNDPERPNKRSRLIKIIITREVVEDCQDHKEAGLKFKEIVENRFSDFNPDHNHSRFISPPIEEWIISTFDIT